VGGSLKYIQSEDPLPLTFAVGNSVRPLKNLALTCDIVFPRDSAPYPSFGSEMRINLDPTLAALLRVGYQRRTNPGDLNGVTGITAGAGLGLSRFSPYSPLPLPHH
jgi:hypothetical protein